MTTDDADPPPFATMTDEALLTWVANTWRLWHQLPAALAALVARRMSYATICERTGVPTTTVHRKARQVSPSPCSAPTATAAADASSAS